MSEGNDDADEALDELTSAGVRALRLPALESLPGETNVSLELFAERLSVLRAVIELKDPTVIIAPIAALMQYVPQPRHLAGLMRTLRKDDTVKLPDLTRWLADAGYRRVEAVEEPGDFALRGGILDVFPPTEEHPVRVELWGDTV